MNTIFLHGHLGEQFGPEYRLSIRDVAEGVKALCLQLPGFRKALEDGEYQIVRGQQLLDSEHLSVDLFLRVPTNMDIHIVPVAAGSKESGLGKVIVGTLLVATAILLPGSTFGATAGLLGPQGSASIAGISASSIATFGGMMVVAGAAQALSPTPTVKDYNDRERPEQRPSYLLNGQVNTIQAGLTIPVIYGRRVRTGSQLVSAGLSVEATFDEGGLITDDGFVSVFNFRRRDGGASVEYTNPPGMALYPNKLMFGMNHWEYVRGITFSGKNIIMSNDDVVTPGGTIQDDHNFSEEGIHRKMYTVAGGNSSYRGKQILQFIEYDVSGAPVLQLALGEGGLPSNFLDEIVVRDAADHDVVLYDIGTKGSSPNDVEVLDNKPSQVIGQIGSFANSSTVWKFDNFQGVTGHPIKDSAANTLNVVIRKFPRVTYDQPFRADKYRDGTWFPDGPTAFSGETNFYGYCLKKPDPAGANRIDMTLPGDHRLFNEIRYRESDRVYLFGEMMQVTDPGTWTGAHYALALGTPARPQNWISDVSLWHGTNKLITLDTSNAEYHSSYLFEDGSEGTLWKWLEQPRGLIASRLKTGLRLKLTYRDLEADLPA